jgi:hypothetical protein
MRIGRINGAVFTNSRLADFRIAPPVAPRELPSEGVCDLPVETQPQTAWVSFGKQRWVTSRKRRSLMDDFKNWCADGNARLPDSWNPDHLEKGCTEVLSEMEKAMQERKSKS